MYYCNSPVKNSQGYFCLPLYLTCSYSAQVVTVAIYRRYLVISRSTVPLGQSQECIQSLAYARLFCFCPKFGAALNRVPYANIFIFLFRFSWCNANSKLCRIFYINFLRVKINSLIKSQLAHFFLIVVLTLSALSELTISPQAM